MADIDVISLIFESFDLVRARYKEVALPLMVLLLISGAGNFGGASLSDVMGSQGAGTNYYDESPIANALSDSGGLWAGLAGVIFIVLALLIAFAFAMAVVSLSIWYYASEHFYAILRRKKVSQNWQSRMARHFPRAIVMTIFEFFLFAAFAAATIACFAMVPASGWAVSIVLFAVVALVAISAMLFLIPAWAYYAMDCLPFFESLGRSVSLVRGNAMHFAIFAVIFIALNFGTVFASFYACCFSFLLMPILYVFFSLISRVTILKMKLAIEKQRNKR